MSTKPGAGLTIGFFGNALSEMAEKVRAFEDEVLALLPAHGALVQFRGRRQEGQPEDRPAEFHVLWFPSEASFNAYLSDPQRAEILARYGEVFSDKVVVRLDPVE